MKRMIMMAALVAALALPVAADEVPGALAPYMSADEYRAAGLHRLSPEERAAFERWFLRTMGADATAEAPPARAPEPPVADARTEDIAEERRRLAEERRAFEEERRRVAETEHAREPDLEDPRLFGFGGLAARTPAVEARLEGRFTGWSRGTRLRLDNGQVWEVTSGDAFRPVRPLDNPEVTIRRMALGSFSFRVEGYNATARVRRVE